MKTKKAASAQHKKLKKQLENLYTEITDINEKLAKAFRASFTGSQEEILFMLDIKNDSRDMYAFISKFLSEKKLSHAFSYPLSSQHGLAVNLYHEESDLRLAAESLKEIFPLIKPVKIKNRKGKNESYTLVELNISSIVDIDNFYSSLFLVKENNLYKATTIDNYHDEIVVDWSDDIASVLIKAKEYLKSRYGYSEDCSESF